MTNDPFAGLDDDLNDVFPTKLTTDEHKAGVTLAASVVARYSEPCPSCRGSGRFIGYSGRTVGDCFKCKGTGKLTFKTAPESRAKAATKRAGDRDQKRIDLQAARDAWIRANSDDFAWMKAKAETFDFANSMYDALMQYGSLTERQHATVTRLRLADVERDRARKVEAAQRAASAPVVDISRIETAFAAAQANGVKKPKMRLGDFKFSLAPIHGANAGALYVTRPADDQYMGKIKDGKFMRVRECTPDQEAAIVAVAAAPHQASIAYGQRTGNCGICGRELTNHASIDLGIGPICAEKYGWA